MLVAFKLFGADVDRSAVGAVQPFCGMGSDVDFAADFGAATIWTTVLVLGAWMPKSGSCAMRAARLANPAPRV
jgi:hypothetical protein